MKFEKWSEHNWLDEISININDSDIKKIGRGKWTFEIYGSNYKFEASPITLRDGTKGFMVEWGLIVDDGSVTTEIVGSNKNVVKVFSKVISCMAIFINEENPDGFMMYANKRLSRVYDAMWTKHHLDEPINRYFSRDRRSHKKLSGEDVYVYHYYKRSDTSLSESQWINVLEMMR